MMNGMVCSTLFYNARFGSEESPPFDIGGRHHQTGDHLSGRGEL